MRWSPISARHRALIRSVAPSIATQLSLGLERGYAPHRLVCAVVEHGAHTASPRDRVHPVQATETHQVYVGPREHFVERARQLEPGECRVVDVLRAVEHAPELPGVVPAYFDLRTPLFERAALSWLHVVRLSRPDKALPAGRIASVLRQRIRDVVVTSVCDAYQSAGTSVPGDVALVVWGWRAGNYFIATPVGAEHRAQVSRHVESRAARDAIAATPPGHLPIVVYGGVELPISVYHAPTSQPAVHANLNAQESTAA